MNLQYKSFPFAAKATGTGDGSTFEGKASVYHVLDSYNEIVAPGAFTACLARFLARGKIRSQHRVTIGKPTMAREDPDALVIGGKISDTTDGRDAKILLKDDVTSSLSIGFVPGPSQVLPTPADVMAYWTKAGYTPSADEVERAKYGARVLLAVELFEVSVVDFPANTECDITAVKTPPSNLISLADLLARAREDVHQVKAGRVLSAANRKRLQAHCEALKAVTKDMDALLAEPEPEAAPENDNDNDIAGDAGDGDGAKARSSAALALAQARTFLKLAPHDPLLQRHP